MRSRSIFFCLCALAFSVSVCADNSEFDIADAGSWVFSIAAFEHANRTPGENINRDNSSGVHYRLFDEQYNAKVPGQLQRFKAIEYSLTNRYAVEAYSRIEIHWHPDYEQLTLHELSLWRDGAIINKRESARIDTLRLEPERDGLIYKGARALSIVFDDVRVGDTIRYSFTISGENPVFNGLREFSVDSDLNFGTDRHYARTIALDSKPLIARTRGDKSKLRKIRTDGTEEWTIDQQNLEERLTEEGVPSWRNNQGTTVFSDIVDWDSIVNWSLPMYQHNGQTPEELVAVASDIHQAHPADSDRIGAALRWVQNEIRYFGVEIGRSTHLPSSPAVTLARRYGDCKDKAVLLISLLGELGIEAYPALVDTSQTLRSDESPFRLHAFDHVIVLVPHQGQNHFIDPTLAYQTGPLGQLFEPDYGRALLIREGESQLVSMPSRLSGRTKQLTKNITIQSDTSNPETSESTAQFAVTTHLQGQLAQNVRRSLETVGLSRIDDEYRKYYQKYFEDVSNVENLTISDSENGLMTLKETYEIRNFWDFEESAERHKWIYADEILSFLDKPEDTSNRQAPYELAHPVVIEEKWMLELPYEHTLFEIDGDLDTRWFKFEKKSRVSDDGKNVEISFRYETRTRVVSAVDLEKYAEYVAQIQELASFYIEDAGPVFDPFAGLASKGIAFWRTVFVAVIAFYLLVALLAFLWTLNQPVRTLDG